jgi:hypothetical protein
MDADSLHRLAKLLIDSGEAASIPEALDTFSRYGVKIHLSGETVHDVGQQILALTAITSLSKEKISS